MAESRSEGTVYGSLPAVADEAGSDEADGLERLLRCCGQVGRCSLVVHRNS
jgi:hypothetical protein